MDDAELRARRKALRLTQTQFADALGLHRNSIGQMERGQAAIEPRTAAAVRALKPAPLDRKPTLSDPMERLIEQALIDAGIRFTTDQGGETESRLDFHLIDYGIEIEVKRFFTVRTGEQIARAPSVILAQGEVAVRFLAEAIRSGDFVLMTLTEAQQQSVSSLHRARRELYTDAL
ncbi:helix-turn-helix domain-containing protein [Sphingomonas abietis]|uniref:Helix-turn-helix transcriptional regulator n=1 Tax=Sphingomonas abietis TaxID=3012344 RepID=A0ABY7NKH9_9SPHN|nr:helix-turn-helix transcriptional regulator [Sphingomonas abietis]WBO21994.1 helix-turn-helix transcriptional regulator [Sphingomonas abietis]